MHAKATLIMDTTASANWPVGGGRRWSSTSLRNSSGLRDNDDSDTEVMSSPGCLPIITSSATTPKL